MTRQLSTGLFLVVSICILIASLLRSSITSNIIPPPTILASKFIAGYFRNWPFNKSQGHSKMAATTRTPVYFLSHGGPNIMFDKEHPAYGKLASIGKEITTKVKPSAVVVFSAHWQAGRNHVEVNTAESLPLIYDYYGFPAEYYRVKYPNKGSPAVAEKVIKAIRDASLEAKGVERGLDHGVFASFMCAFDPVKNPLDVPIVQVSLFDTDDPEQHIKLGRAVEPLREQNILIIVSGMAVHNLRDLRFTMGNARPMPYSTSFDAALKEAVETTPGSARDETMIKLVKRPDARQAHPTFEHLLPIHIGVGAAGVDAGKQTWTLCEASMSWAQFRFGAVGA